MRLIDADALLEGRQDHEMISTHMIWNAPTIDAVPVVRCKDCAYYFSCNNECGVCEDFYADPDGYCSNAKRRYTDGE